jgi:hypothetical protein
MLPAWILPRFSFVCVAVSEALEQLHCERHGLSAPVRKRTHRAGAVLCVPYAAASRADRSCTFYRQDHRRDQLRQLPVPLQFLPAPDQVPYAMGIYPEDRYPEEKTHNHAKNTYVPYLVVRRLTKIVKCGGCTARTLSSAETNFDFGFPRRCPSSRFTQIEERNQEFPPKAS